MTGDGDRRKSYSTQRGPATVQVRERVVGVRLGEPDLGRMSPQSTSQATDDV